MKTLGAIVHAARIERELTLRAAAKGLGISSAYLSELENDIKTPDKEETIVILANYYELNVKDLMFTAKMNTPLLSNSNDNAVDQLAVARRIATGDLTAETFKKIQKVLEEAGVR